MIHVIILTSHTFHKTFSTHQWLIIMDALGMWQAVWT